MEAFSENISDVKTTKRSELPQKAQPQVIPAGKSHPKPAVTLAGKAIVPPAVPDFLIPFFCGLFFVFLFFPLAGTILPPAGTAVGRGFLSQRDTEPKNSQRD